MPNLKPPLKESARPSGLAVFDGALRAGEGESHGPRTDLTGSRHAGQHWPTQGCVVGLGAPTAGECTPVPGSSGIVGMVGWANGVRFRFRGRYCPGAGAPLSQWSPWVQATAVF